MTSPAPTEIQITARKLSVRFQPVPFAMCNTFNTQPPTAVPMRAPENNRKSLGHKSPV